MTAGQEKRVRLSPDERRELILRAAAEVFTEVGYRDGKVATIAARVGVTEPVVFQNFGSKAALFAAVLDRVTGAAREELASAVERDGSVSRALAGMLAPEHMARMHAPGSMGMLFADAASLAGDEAIGGAARRAVRAVADALAELLRRGQADGDVHADVDPVAGAWWVLSMTAARPFRAAVAPDDTKLEAGLADLTVRLFTEPSR